MKIKSTTLAIMAISALAVVSSRGALIISQYYEGASNDKYIEIQNVGATTVDFSVTSFTIAGYNNGNRENWKTGGTFTNSTLLNTGTLASGSTLIVRNSSAAAPSYAASLGITSGAIGFNGDDSFVIFRGASTAFVDVEDAFGVTTTSGFDDKSYVRKTAVPTNADFDSALWDVYTLTQVADAGVSAPERLGYSSIAPVPEPSVAILSAFGALALIRRRR